MKFIENIQQAVADGVRALYQGEVAAADVAVTTTRKEFSGDYTIVVFPFTKLARKKPDEIAVDLGSYLQAHLPFIADFNVIKGFLNLNIARTHWRDFLLEMAEDEDFGRHERLNKKVLVEFSSPNTNKPLHLGHIRNILLGWSTSKILDAAGYDVVRVQIVNDRGIAICKSMLAWQEYGQGATPESKGVKSDHFVGDYYVTFEKKFQEEYKAWQAGEEGRATLQQHAKEDESAGDFFKRYKDQYFNRHSALGARARAMLRRWEENDPATIDLWKRMNGWVYAGFDETYEQLGVEFDKLYYESDTYLLGKDMIEKGLREGVFYRREDGSVWADLTDAKLDHKIVLRADGTSVYITQDLGTARLRYEDFGVEKMVYVVADEQNYHFQVLFEILKRLDEPYADGLYHLAYGMVDLTTGKMKSREGTVVDADDLIAEVTAAARENSQERDTTSDLSEEARERIIRQIGLAALRFFILKVNPQKRMVFDPKESVDLHGHTGPYIQNAYVRIQSVLRKASAEDIGLAKAYTDLADDEKDLIVQLYGFPTTIEQAAREYDPSTVANYCYSLAKAYHKFYHDYSILNADTEAARAFRLALSRGVANVLKAGMDLLGIEMPERM